MFRIFKNSLHLIQHYETISPSRHTCLRCFKRVSKSSKIYLPLNIERPLYMSSRVHFSIQPTTDTERRVGVRVHFHIPLSRPFAGRRANYKRDFTVKPVRSFFYSPWVAHICIIVMKHTWNVFSNKYSWRLIFFQNPHLYFGWKSICVWYCWVDHRFVKECLCFNVVLMGRLYCTIFPESLFGWKQFPFDAVKSLIPWLD